MNHCLKVWHPDVTSWISIDPVTSTIFESQWFFLNCIRNLVMSLKFPKAPLNSYEALLGFILRPRAAYSFVGASGPLSPWNRCSLVLLSPKCPHLISPFSWQACWWLDSASPRLADDKKYRVTAANSRGVSVLSFCSCSPARSVESISISNDLEF